MGGEGESLLVILRMARSKGITESLEQDALCSVVRNFNMPELAHPMENWNDWVLVILENKPRSDLFFKLVEDGTILFEGIDGRPNFYFSVGKVSTIPRNKIAMFY